MKEQLLKQRKGNFKRKDFLIKTGMLSPWDSKQEIICIKKEQVVMKVEFIMVKVRRSAAGWFRGRMDMAVRKCRQEQAMEFTHQFSTGKSKT